MLRDVYDGITERLTLTGTFGNYVGDYPTTGTVTGASYSITGGASFTFTDVSMSVADFTAYIMNNDLLGMLNTLLGGNDTVNGSSGADALAAFDGDDTLNGGGGADELSGGLGNDTIDGGTGNDLMAGGLGDDIYVVSQAGDAVIEFAGEGWDEVRTTLSSSDFTDGVEVLRYTGAGDFTGIGNDLGNRIYGRDGNDVLLGNGGADTFFAGIGNDSVDGGSGNDWLVASVIPEAGLAPATGPVSYTISQVAANTNVVSGANGQLNVQTVAVENIELSDQRGEDVTVDVGAGAGQVRIFTGAGDDTITLSRTGNVYAGLGANTVVLGA